MDDKILHPLRRAIPFLLATFIVFNPVPHTTAVKEICFYLALALTLILIVKRSVDFTIDSPFSRPFALYCLWTIFGLVFAENFTRSFHDIYAHLLKYIIFYSLLINFFTTRRHFEMLARVVFISAAVFSVGAIIEFYWIAGNPLTTRVDYQELPLNVMGHVPLFAIILGTRLLTSEKQRARKILISFSIAAMTFLILLTQSRGSLLGLAFGIIFLIRDNRKLIVSLLLVLISFSLFVPDKFHETKFDSSGRFEIWHKYVSVIERNPVTGLGFDLSFWQDPLVKEKYCLTVKMFDSSMDPHNIFVSNAVRLGLVGLALYLFILYRFLAVSWKLVRRAKSEFINRWSLVLTAAFFSYLLKGMFDESLSHVPAIIFCIILAMQTILWRLNASEE